MRHALLSLIVLAACSGSPYEPAREPLGPPEVPTPELTATVAIYAEGNEDGYVTKSWVHPEVVTILQNGTVTWVNATMWAYPVKFTQVPGAPEDIDDTRGAQSRTFTTLGVFRYSSLGMIGEVHVVPPVPE